MFTEEQLQAMIRKQKVSEQYPYSENDDEGLVHYLMGRLSIRHTVILSLYAT